VKQTIVAVARTLAQGAGRAHGFYFLTATAACAAASAAFDGPARLVPVAVAWWIAAVHELGHALLALALGMQVQACVAIPGFGRTRIRHGGRRLPFGVIALAGPLAGIAAAISVATYVPSTAFGGALGDAARSWLVALGWLGALESALNLLPIHPRLDGSAALAAFRIARRERARERESRRRRAPERWAVAPQPSAAGVPPRAAAARAGFLGWPGSGRTPLPAAAPRPIVRSTPLVPRALAALLRRDRHRCGPRKAVLRLVA
jgi:hypothetical protein